MLLEALNHVRIEVLNLTDNAIRNKGVEYLPSVSNSTNLVDLEVVENRIGTRGFQAISTFLQKGDTMLKKLSVGSFAVFEKNGEYGDTYLDPMLISIAVPSLQQLVCNMPSFEYLCQQLSHIFW